MLSDLLCFITSKFGKVEVKMLRTVILDFYHTEDILQAKWRLIDDITELHLEQTPRVSRRREGEKHIVRDLDDIFTLLTFLDENKLNSKLPLYVTDDPDRMPSLRLFEGDLKYFYTKLDQFDNKMETFGSAMAAMINEWRTHLSEWPALCPPASRSIEQQPKSKLSTTANNSDVRQPPSNHQPSWAVMTSSPNYHGTRNRFAVLASTDDDDHSDAARHDDTPMTVVSRRKKRMRQREGPSPESQSVNQTNQATAPRQQPRTVVYGKAVSTDVKVTAACRLRTPDPAQRKKKAVYCLDNINKDCTVDDIKSYVSKLSVEVFTCYEVKSRRRRGEEQPSSERIAFRLCIAADDRERLLDPASWPHSVIISDWYFKSQDGNKESGDKRMRTDSAAETEMGQPQQQQQQQQQQQSPAVCHPTTVAVTDVSATSGQHDDSTILASSMDYHDGCQQ